MIRGLAALLGHFVWCESNRGQPAPLAEFEHFTLTLQPVRVLNILGSETNGVQNCTASRIGHEANCVLGSLRCPTRNEGASRAGRHLEGTCALAIRLCSR